MEKKKIIRAFSIRWEIDQAILEDIYFILLNDLRFYSTRNGGGLRYKLMEQHLKKHYKLDVTERKLRYLVLQIKRGRER